MCGLFKGGLCYYFLVDIDYVCVFVLLMIWKIVVVGIFYGGVKGGIVVDLCKLFKFEFEWLMCKFM